MSKQKSLLSLTLMYTAGNLSSRVMSFVLVFFTTFYLSKEDVGEFDLILITLSLFTPFVTFQLTDAALRWLLDDHSVENSTKVFSTIFYILLVSIVLFSFGIFSYNYFLPVKYVFILIILLFLQSFNAFFLQCIRGFGNNKMYVSNGLINTFIYVGLSITALTFFKLKVEGLLYANCIATAISGVLLFINGKLYNYLNYKTVTLEFAKKLLSYSLPLLPNSISWWAISSANRYVILLFLGASANGVFAIAYKLPTILLMFINIFYLAWQEKAITNFKRDDRDLYYSEVFEKYIRVLFTLSIIIVASNKLLLHYIVSKEFFEAWQYTPILLLSIIFSSMAGFYGTGYLSSKKTKGAFTSSVFGGLTTVAFSFILIPKFQLFGASFAIALGYLVLVIIRIFHTRTIFKIVFPIKTFFTFFLFFILITFLNYGNFYLLIVNIFIAVIGLIVLNFQEIKIIFDKILEAKKNIFNHK